MDMDKIRKIAAVEVAVKEAIAVINKASLELNSLNMDTKISGWNWDKPGWTASLCAQGRLAVRIVYLDERPLD